MSRLPRILTIAGVLALIPSTAWVLRRWWERPSAMPDEAQPLGYGSAARRFVYRVGRAVRGDFAPDDGLDGDGEPIAFDWAFGATDAGVVGTALATEGIPVDSAGLAPDDRDMIVTDKLTSAGIHLDQEPPAGFGPVPRSRYVGKASPGRLMRAVERALDTRHSGVIVDTSRGATVEIDEHPNVGKGNVVLIDATGSRMLRHGSTRLLLQALQDASERRHATPAGAPDIPRSGAMA
jgi:hypothetical protein